MHTTRAILPLTSATASGLVTYCLTLSVQMVYQTLVHAPGYTAELLPNTELAKYTVQDFLGDIVTTDLTQS